MNPPPPPKAVLAGPPGPLPHWFFTGYSDQRENIPLVQRFHDDVDREVRSILGKLTPGKGFVDFQDIKPGEPWEPRVLRNGVCTTRAMLVLYSPSYFQSRWCAREWTVFTARVDRYQDNGGRTPCLIGVLWQKGEEDWPDVVNRFQYVRRDQHTTYEKHGLIHIVPRRPEDPGSPEYRGLVLEVADLIAKARRATLPSIKVTETKRLRPPFGPESSLPVDYVVAYVTEDESWGHWVHTQLEQRGKVDVLPLDEADGRPDRLKEALSRAGRVVLLVSRRSLTVGYLTKAAIDAAFADPVLLSDLPRLVPFFIEQVPDETVPVSLLPLVGNALYGIPEPETVQDILVAAVTAPVLTPTDAAQDEPAYPPTAVRPSDRALVDNLMLASSVSDPVIRDVWIGRTGLDRAGLPNPQLPPRPWLFDVLRACMRQYGSYEPLAMALEDLELESPEALQVRKIVDDLKLLPSE